MANDKRQMAPASTDEQFKFLISCIRWSNNGKVDFAAVAQECEIISKGAAAKRYERMMKQHGLHQGASASRDPPASPVPASEAKPTKASSTKASTKASTKVSSTKASFTKASTNKKRKVTAMDDATELGQDDHEGLSGHIKAEGDVDVKDELDDIANSQTLSTTAAGGRVRTGEASDDGLVHDYLHSNAVDTSREESTSSMGYDGAYDLTPYADPGAMDPGSIFID